MPSSADEWFAAGCRVHFDPNHKKIAPHATSNTIQVFERIGLPYTDNIDEICSSSSARWITFLPSFPNGSFGYANVEKQLLTGKTAGSDARKLPRLYIEYVGQGDSEKPLEYAYGTMERADLVQAQWAAHNVQETVIVAMGYSSLVVMELVRRQQERERVGKEISTRILHVLGINGAWYANDDDDDEDDNVDNQTRPHLRHRGRRLWLTKLLLQSSSSRRRVGQLSASLAQRSNIVLDFLLRNYFNSSTGRRKWHSHEELREIENAIRRHDGASTFLAQAASVLLGEEHQDWADRWNLSEIFWDDYMFHCDDDRRMIAWDIVGSRDDIWHGHQLGMVQKRLGSYSDHIKISSLPGGHLVGESESPAVCQHIEALVSRALERQDVGNKMNSLWT